MIEDEIKKLALDAGADLVGICTADSLKDKDFSDANFVLPGAQSIISIAIGMNDENVRKFLSKEDRKALSFEEGEMTKKLKHILIKIYLALPS